MPVNPHTHESPATLVVTCDQSGDWAEAPTPEAALVAARTLMEDANDWRPLQGFKPTVTFTNNGVPVPGLVSVGQPAVWAALAKEAA